MLAGGENAPGTEAGFGDHRAAGFGDGDKMGENPWIAPSLRAVGGAYGAIFAGLVVLHQDRADSIGSHIARQFARRQPQTFEFSAHRRPARVDLAAARQDAIGTGGPGGLL